MENKKKKIIGIVALIILIPVIALIVFGLRDKEPEQVVEKEPEVQQEDSEIVEGTEEEDKQEEVVIPVDFATLKTQNEDVYAWIDIEDTNVHYPILQSPTDDSYYLNHTIDHVKGLPGSIYTESVNSKDFSDFNTLIYGHDMKNGTMFKHLHKFENKEFFDTHETIVIYTETEIKTYRIYAAVIYDDRHIMYAYDQDDVADRKEFIQSLRTIGEKGSLFREGMEIDENSKLITLSTCISGRPNRRYIVVAEEVVD